MGKLSRDFSTGNLHARENIGSTTATNIVALNGELQIDADGANTVSLVVSGTYVGTLVVEGSIDGTNWDAIPLRPVSAGGSYLMTLASAAIGRWSGPMGIFRRVRVRMSAFTSGTASVVLQTGLGITDITAIPKAADQSATITAAAGSAATLTLPAVTGLFHYITRMIIQRHTSALLIAAATPIVVTTTNMPGSKAFSFPADAATQGTVAQEILEPSNPMRSSASGTATTVVMPAITSVIWRATADYYLAP